MLAPSRLALLVLWVASTVTLVFMLTQGVRSTGQYETLRYFIQTGYVAALLWHLARTGPSLARLPELEAQVFPRWRYGAWLPVLAIGMLLLLTMFSDDGVDILMLLLIVATLWTLIAWRRKIRLRSVLQGMAVALATYLAALPMVRNDFIGDTVLILLPALTAPMFVAGGLLCERTGLSRIQLLTGGYVAALKSLARGILLFIPLGLINAAEGSPGSGITWVTEWWMPITLPWFSGIAEEAWFRLLLVGMCYFLLRPALRTRPALALVLVVLFSGITFGLGHDRTLERFLTTGLLYGVPMAAVFARRDWEHAVGAHYVINMIPWLMVFLEV
jgi:hypothetical protein